MNRGRISIYILFFLLIQNVGFGADKFRVFKKQDGLSSNRLYSSVEDKDGFIWITSEKGVDRFDGRFFKHYSLKFHDESSSFGYLFYFILTDSDKNIFVLANRGHLYKYNPKTDDFIPVAGFEKNHGLFITSASIDSDNNLLFGTANSFFAYNLETGVRENLNKIEARVHSILPYGDHQFLLGTTNGLLTIDSLHDAPHYLGAVDSTFTRLGNNYKTKKIFLDSIDQKIWIGTISNGLYYYDMELGKMVKPEFHRFQIHEYPIYDIVKLENGSLLIATDGSGIYKINPYSMEIVRHFLNNEDNLESISSNVVYNFSRTKNGMIFISTDYGGLNLYNPNLPDFHTIKHQLGNENSLNNNVVHAVVEITPGVVCFGTDLGLSTWNLYKNRWSFYNRSKKKGTRQNEVITSLHKASDHSIWVGSFINPLALFDYTTHWENISGLPRELRKGKHVKTMFMDHKHSTLWVGHASNELYSYDFRRRSLKGYPINFITTIANYSSSKLLVGNRQGVFIINKNSGEIKDFFKNRPKLKPESIKISCLFVDLTRKVWIGTYNSGIYSIDTELNKLTSYNSTTGLTSNVIHAILQDNEGKIWLSTDNSISSIDVAQNEVQNYFISDGLPSTDFMDNSACKASDGTLFFGSANGAVYFKPAQISMQESFSKLVLTEFYVNQKKISVEKGSILKTRLNETKTIDLNHDENSFSIVFNSIDFIHPEQNLYSWKLDGFDRQWTQPVLANRVDYSNLSPGRYTLRIKKISKSSAVNDENYRVINVIIRKPAWKSPLAFIAYLLIILLMGTIILYYNSLMHKVKSSRAHLRFLMDIAHQIKTPLSLIRAPIGDLLQEQTDGDSKERLSLAMKNVEKLQSKINQFLDFKKVSRAEALLHIEEFDLVQFLKDKIYAYKVLAEKNEIQLNFEPGTDKINVYSDQELLDKIVDNLLSNAIKFNKRNGYVNIRIHTDSKNWGITITDSGIGIPKRDQKKVFDLFHRAKNAVSQNIRGSGVGLVLAYDLTKHLKGKLSFKSQEEKGSSFTLMFPAGKSSFKPSDFDEVLQHENEDLEQHDVAGSCPEISPNRISDFKILVVEDDDELRSYMKTRLSEKYNILDASNGKEALDVVRNYMPDLIVSDIVMPKMNGRQLCMNIKSNIETCHIPVILLTGMDSKENMLRGIEAGADDYIPKPFDSLILIAKIDNLLNSRKVLKAKFLIGGHKEYDHGIQNDYDKELIKSITNLIEKNISDPDLSVKTLCMETGMSRTALYHKLKILIDLSPAEFIRTVRLKKAQDLLLSNKHNINEVAYLVGFSDSKYFSTCFKRQFGESPSTFVSKAKIQN